MNTPTTLFGVLGAGLILALTILKMVNDGRAQAEKAKADENAKIAKISNADDVVRIANELRGK